MNNRNLRIEDLAKQIETRFGITIGERELNHIAVYDETVTRARGGMVLETAPFITPPSPEIAHTLAKLCPDCGMISGYQKRGSWTGLSDELAGEMGPVFRM